VLINAMTGTQQQHQWMTLNRTAGYTNQSNKLAQHATPHFEETDKRNQHIHCHSNEQITNTYPDARENTQTVGCNDKRSITTRHKQQHQHTNINGNTVHHAHNHAS